MNKKTKQKIVEDISPCNGCYCMTKSIRKGRAHYVCGKCGHDKSLSDVFFAEVTGKNKIKGKS